MALNLNLGNLTVAQGFAINGETASDQSGYSVSGAGDVNGDGYDDVIIGAPGASESYLIYGSPFLDDINLANLGMQGFSMADASSGSDSGYSVSGAGDVNGDGYADVIIGAPNANNNAGISYVVFGNATNSNINLANLTNTQGISIVGANVGDGSGISVSGAGDVNKDGYADIIIGAPNVNNKAGASYVIYGGSNLNNIFLSTPLSTEQGFSILGVSNSQSGWGVSKAGDINNDGFDDVIIGASLFNDYTGASYVLYGGINLTTIALVSLNLTQGFSIIGINIGYNTGLSSRNAGDVNHDGYGDVIIGAYGAPSGGESYIIYGGVSLTNIYLSNLSVSQGVYLYGAATTGFAGDINKDGYDDVIVGTQHVDGNAGITYLIYGKENLLNINLTSLNSSQGFSMTGVAGSRSGCSVSGAGDINKDGYDDVIVGAFFANSEAGESYVIYGAASGFVTPSPTLTPTAAPTSTPTATPTAPTIIPTPSPTATPTLLPTTIPTAIPTPSPTTATPTLFPTTTPTTIPTPLPTPTPTISPTSATVYCYNMPVCSGSSVDTIFIISTDVDELINSGGGNDQYQIDTITTNSIVVTIQGFTSLGIIDLTAFTTLHNLNDLNIHYDPTNIILPNGEIISLSGYTNILNPNNFIFSTNTPSPSITPVSTPAQSVVDGVAFKAAFGAASFVASLVGGWVLRTKIAFYILDNWGHNYKFLYQNFRQEILKENEIGLRLNNDKLVCVIKNNEYPLPIDDSNHEGISRVLHKLIIQALKNPIISQSFTLIQSEKNQIRDFLITHKYLTTTKTYCLLNSFTELGYVKGTVYNLFLHNFEEAHTKACKKHVRFEDVKQVSMEKYSEDSIISTDKDSHNQVVINYIHQSSDVENSLGNSDVEISQQDTKSLNANHDSSAKRGCVLMSIDAMMDPEHVRLQNEEFSRFGNSLIHIAEELFSLDKLSIKQSIANTKEDMKLLADGRHDENPKSASSSTYPTANLLAPLLGIRQAIEYMPIVKYLVQNIAYPLVENYLPESVKNISLPEITNSMIVAVHLATGHLGVMLLPQESINGLAISTAGSASFGIRLAASHYLNEQRQDALAQDKPMDAFEVTKYCAATMLAYTVPSIATCAIANFIMPGYQCGELALSTKISLAGAECYSVYKASIKTMEAPTTADVVVPYIADGIALLASCANGGSVMSVVSSVVTADYMTKIAMDTMPNELKKEYIDQVFDYAQGVYACGVDVVSQMLGAVQDY